MAIIATMQISNVKKLKQKKLRMRLEEVKDQVKSVLLNLIQRYIGKEGNISLRSVVVHTSSLYPSACAVKDRR